MGRVTQKFQIQKLLIQYLLASWNDDYFADILGEKVIFANLRDTCYIYQVVNDKMSVNEFEHLYSTHDEADSRILFHLNWCSSMYGVSNVVIRASDTDILIIGLLYIACR